MNTGLAEGRNDGGLKVLLSLLLVASFLVGCGLTGKKGKATSGGSGPVQADSVEMTLAIPLTPEQATALAGINGGNDISRTDELVMDIFANDELVAEGVSGGIRAGVRGGVRSAVRGGVRAAGVRQAPGDPSTGLRVSGSDSVRAELVEARRQEADSENISFQASFFLPKHIARDGDNTVRARVRHRDKPAAEFVEVKTKITISGAGDPAQIEILDRDIPLNEVILPDVDGDGVATLMEAISLGIEAALDGTTRPTEEQVRAIIDQYAQKLIAEMKRQGLIVTVDSSKIDLKPPVGGLGFAEGEVTVGNLPKCEAGRTQPETDAVQTEQTAATFVLCADEPARFQCSTDGGRTEPCATPLLLKGLEFGRHSIGVLAQDGNGNTQPTILSFRWAIAPKDLPAPTGLKVTAGDGGVFVSWNAVTGATKYRIYYGAAGSGLASSMVSTETSTSIGGLTNGNEYRFSVSALAGEKESPRSEAVSATPVAGAKKVISAPTGVTATAGDKKVTLAWGAVEGAGTYKIHYGTSQENLTTVVDVTGVSAEIAGLTNGTVYYFAVSALDASGAESGKSEIVQAAPSAVATTTGTPLCALDSAKLNSCVLG